MLLLAAVSRGEKHKVTVRRDAIGWKRVTVCGGGRVEKFDTSVHGRLARIINEVQKYS